MHMMNSNEYFNLVNEDGLYRLNRIASVFCTKNDGPFRISNRYKIDIIDDDTTYLGSIEFLKYLDNLYYYRAVASTKCYSFDDDRMLRFYGSLRLLFWLDECWNRPRFLCCPLCHEELDLFDNFIDDKKVSHDGKYLIDILTKHIGKQHPNIDVFGLKEDCMRVFLKTTLGNFEIENFYAY